MLYIHSMLCYMSVLNHHPPQKKSVSSTSKLLGQTSQFYISAWPGPGETVYVISEPCSYWLSVVACMF